MAKANRVRHLIHGGYVRVDTESLLPVFDTTHRDWKTVSRAPIDLLQIDGFGARLWSLTEPDNLSSQCGMYPLE